MQSPRLSSTSVPQSNGVAREEITMAHVDYVLFEAALGYALFNVVHQADAVGAKLKEVQTAVNELPKFSKMVNLVNFTPFR